MAGKLSKTIWPEKFELSSLSYLSLTGKMICRSKCLVNTDIWFNLIRGSSLCTMWVAHPQGKGEWKSREFTPALCQGLSGSAGNASEEMLTAWGDRVSPRPWEQLPILAQHAHLGWDWGLCAGVSQSLLEEGKSKYPFIPECHGEDGAGPVPADSTQSFLLQALVGLSKSPCANGLIKIKPVHFANLHKEKLEPRLD